MAICRVAEKRTGLEETAETEVFGDPETSGRAATRSDSR